MQGTVYTVYVYRTVNVQLLFGYTSILPRNKTYDVASAPTVTGSDFLFYVEIKIIFLLQVGYATLSWPIFSVTFPYLALSLYGNLPFLMDFFL